MEHSKTPLVSMRGISKLFFGIHANQDVDFDLFEGEVHGLLGENGAGKTTLMNVLCGIYTPDKGTLSIEGNPVCFLSPKDAIACGVGMVHQHFMLVPVLSVWENMLLGLKDVPMVLDREGTIARIRELSQTYGLEVDPEAKVWQLSIGEQQRVEILKMLYRGTKILILDEPTSVLTPQEVLDFFATLRRMTAIGHAIVLISHKVEEMLSIADKLTILRKGKKIDTVSSEGITRMQIAEMMVGRPLGVIEKKDYSGSGAVLLECRDISVRNDRNLPGIKNISFSLREGEILGVAGVSGNGQGEMCEALCGLRKIDSGHVFMGEKEITHRTVRERIQDGISYIPVDRKGTGLIPNMNLRENIALKYYWEKPYREHGCYIRWDRIASLTADLVRDYNIAVNDLKTPVRALSGGNLQKLMLSREISKNPTINLAMHPVWGLDVGATEFVHRQLLKEREQGAGILLISEDLDELLEMSDRILVLCQGELMGTVENPQAIGRDRIGLMMGGEQWTDPAKESA